MNVNFKGTYKSISTFQWNDIPKFVVISGANGTGKTQLLELIDSFFRKSSHVKNITKGKIEIENLNAVEKDVLFLKDQWYLKSGSLISPSAYGEQRKSSYEQYLNSGRNPNNRSSQNEPFFRELDLVIDKPNRTEVEQAEFFEAFPKILKFDPNGLSDEIASQFCNYRIRELEYLAEGGDVKAFVTENGERPWDILNQLLNKIDSPYQFTTPVDTSLSLSYKLAVIDMKSKKVIDFNDLSSGEKVIISLLLFVLVSELYDKVPKLILLDEPDAHLHPSLTKEFLSSISDVLVDKFDCRVIMTTHSPSTVSLSPEGCLFEMQRTEPRLVQVSNKSNLIKKLTSGLLTVTKSTKYVLVEDYEDVDFYSNLLESISDKRLIKINTDIIFVSSSKENKPGGGGKSVVKSWTEKLNEVGLNYLFMGLVDRDFDTTTNSNDSLIYTSRHSLENYLLDPIVVFTVLLEGSSIPINRHNLMVGKEFLIQNLENIVLQDISDEIISKIDISDKENYGISTSYIEYHNDKKIEIPSWLLVQRGKDLMSLFRNKFGRKINHRDLMKAFCRLNLIPKDLIDLITKIEA